MLSTAFNSTDKQEEQVTAFWRISSSSVTKMETNPYKTQNTHLWVIMEMNLYLALHIFSL